MNKTLLKSVREYKKQSVMAPSSCSSGSFYGSFDPA